jgi:hypothetical protein
MALNDDRPQQARIVTARAGNVELIYYLCT